MTNCKYYEFSLKHVLVAACQSLITSSLMNCITIRCLIQQMDQAAPILYRSHLLLCVCVSKIEHILLICILHSKNGTKMYSLTPPKCMFFYMFIFTRHSGEFSEWRSIRPWCIVTVRQCVTFNLHQTQLPVAR